MSSHTMKLLHLRGTNWSMQLEIWIKSFVLNTRRCWMGSAELIRRAFAGCVLIKNTRATTQSQLTQKEQRNREEIFKYNLSILEGFPGILSTSFYSVFYFLCQNYYGLKCILGFYFKVCGTIISSIYISCIFSV